MLVLAMGVWSHWLRDLAVHAADMPLWPESTTRLGFHAVCGGNAGWFEILVVAICCVRSARRARSEARFGRSVTGSVAVVLVCLALEWTQ
jgi:hypothetical protein